LKQDAELFDLFTVE